MGSALVVVVIIATFRFAPVTRFNSIRARRFQWTNRRTNGLSPVLGIGLPVSVLIAISDSPISSWPLFLTRSLAFYFFSIPFRASVEGPEGAFVCETAKTNSD